MTHNPTGDEIQYLQLSIQGGSTGAIADLESLAGDIEYARWCAHTYLEGIGPDGPQEPEATNFKRALWTACCITYRRVFTNGKGHINPQTPRLKPNDSFTAALTPEQLEAHNEVLETANRHVAHRVNELEQVKIFAVLNPPPLPRAVAGVGRMMIHYVGPTDPALVQRFITVCDLLLGSTIQERDRLSGEALEAIQQRADLDQMYADAHNPNEQGNT